MISITLSKVEARVTCSQLTLSVGAKHVDTWGTSGVWVIYMNVGYIDINIYWFHYITIYINTIYWD